MNAPATADIPALMLDMGKRARAALPALQKATPDDRTKALHAMAAEAVARAVEAAVRAATPLPGFPALSGWPPPVAAA